jgi:proteasome accessory factor A
MRRDVPWDDVVTGLLPFLVTRQLYAGAGKVGIEDENHELRGAIYQLAQRSDFFSVLTSIDTMNRRPIVNTRDEPHADERLYRRLHIITGDANMSEWATAMKIGTTTLIIDLIERRAIPSIALDDPILAIRNISRDMSRRWLVTLENGRSISALDLQWIYLSAAKTFFESGSHSGNDEPDSDTIWVLAEWERVLNDLARDPALCGDRCDWVAKYQLLNAFREAESLSWDAPWLQSLDLEYHNICRDEGLFYELHRENRFQRIVEERDVREAIFHPPSQTRAFARGRIVAKFDTAIRSISWNEIVFEPAAGEPPLAFRFDHASHHPAVDQLNEAVETVHTASDLAQAMHAARAGTSGGAEEASR